MWYYITGKIAAVLGPLRFHTNRALGYTLSKVTTDFVSADFCVSSRRIMELSQQSVLKDVAVLKCWYFSEIFLKGHFVFPLKYWMLLLLHHQYFFIKIVNSILKEQIQTINGRVLPFMPPQRSLIWGAQMNNHQLRRMTIWLKTFLHLFSSVPLTPCVSYTLATMQLEDLILDHNTARNWCSMQFRSGHADVPLHLMCLTLVRNKPTGYCLNNGIDERRRTCRIQMCQCQGVKRQMHIISFGLFASATPMLQKLLLTLVIYSIFIFLTKAEERLSKHLES